MNASRDTIDAITQIDFSELGCHWLNPNRRKLDDAERGRQAGCQKLLAAFVERYGVKPFRRRYRNLQGLLKQGGAGSDQVKAVLERKFDARRGYMGSVCGFGHTFDHPELWGRDGVPLFLIGHPYGVSEDGRSTLEAIRSLGMVVSDYHPSWYGFGTCQIRVYHPETVKRLTGTNNRK